MSVSLPVPELRLLASSWALALRADRKSPQTLKDLPGWAALLPRLVRRPRGRGAVPAEPAGPGRRRTGQDAGGGESVRTHWLPAALTRRTGPNSRTPDTFLQSVPPAPHAALHSPLGLSASG